MKTYLFFNTNRTGYAPSQVMDYRGTMTVRELRELLEDYDDDTPVMYKNDNGYTFGEIAFCDIELEDDSEYEDGEDDDEDDEEDDEDEEEE